MTKAINLHIKTARNFRNFCVFASAKTREKNEQEENALKASTKDSFTAGLTDFRFLITSPEKAFHVGLNCIGQKVNSPPSTTCNKTIKVNFNENSTRSRFLPFYDRARTLLPNGSRNRNGNARKFISLCKLAFFLLSLAPIDREVKVSRRRLVNHSFIIMTDKLNFSHIV